jgi:hypothetical protein
MTQEMTQHVEQFNRDVDAYHERELPTASDLAALGGASWLALRADREAAEFDQFAEHVRLLRRRLTLLRALARIASDRISELTRAQREYARTVVSQLGSRMPVNARDRRRVLEDPDIASQIKPLESFLYGETLHLTQKALAAAESALAERFELSGRQQTTAQQQPDHSRALQAAHLPPGMGDGWSGVPLRSVGP